MPARYKLVCKSRNGAKQSVPFGSSDLIIGSAPECGVVIPNDSFISRQHLRLFSKDGRMHAEDLGSSNGSLLRLRQPTTIEPGDELVVGTTVLRLEPAENQLP